MKLVMKVALVLCATLVAAAEEGIANEGSTDLMMRRSLRVPGGNGDEASSLALERMLAAPISDVCFPTPANEVRAVFKVNNVGGPVTVNGNPSEWDTSVDGPDFVTYMYNSGNADSFGGFEEAAMLFLRWDCTQKKLCALVLTQPNNCISNSATWFKDYSIGISSEIPAVSPGIKLVEGTDGNYVGWEGCFQPYGSLSFYPTGCRNKVEFHAQYGVCSGTDRSKTASSGRSDDFIGLDLSCPLTRPPTSQPTRQPSAKPSSKPSAKPSRKPSAKPSRDPSSKPSNHPSAKPSRKPSSKPSDEPSDIPSTSPSNQPSDEPSSVPSNKPSSKPSAKPSRKPSSKPSKKPSATPSENPSRKPTNPPTKPPTFKPTGLCTDTAWAVWNVTTPKQNCLNTLPGLTSNKWGWFLGPIKSGYSATHKIYAGAGLCDLTKGTCTGKLTVVYNGNTILITVLAPKTGYYSVAHYWVGTTQLPKKNGAFTDAPGSFNKTKYPSSPTFGTYTATPVSGPMYVAFHLEWSRAC